MATKDDRKIVSNVRQGGEVYGPGREDELAAALPQERLDALVKAGALSGTWKGGGAAAEAEEVEGRASAKGGSKASAKGGK